MSEMHPVEKDVPDFAQLGIESLYSWQAWAEAWNALANPALWPNVVRLVESGSFAPVAAAARVMWLSAYVTSPASTP